MGVVLFCTTHRREGQIYLDIGVEERVKKDTYWYFWYNMTRYKYYGLPGIKYISAPTSLPGIIIPSAPIIKHNYNVIFVHKCQFIFNFQLFKLAITIYILFYLRNFKVIILFDVYVDNQCVKKRGQPKLIDKV